MPRSPRFPAAVAIAALVAAVPSGILASGAVEVARVTDRMGSPTYQVRGAPGTAYRCVAMDASGAPLATAIADRATGIVMFPQVKGDAVDRVTCEAQ